MFDGGGLFRYGIQTGKCEWNAAENLRGALKTKKTEHFRALDIKEVPDFLKALERNEARLFERTRRAVCLSLYTFCRPKEIRMARWQDIDFEEGLWTVPAEIMKMKREHMLLGLISKIKAISLLLMLWMSFL
ncbi:MAG: tyrosine-type recombinase/integrase [Rhodospirillales bacterium]|nr:tyrosine-type recombinase/integrase [Alphaproteobacteria bacterium]USO05463.1 MAG: tyrosine-type recombinase/integrase [Rhodospirillales bacterium]